MPDPTMPGTTPAPERNERDIALEKWQKVGRLGVTYRDHLDIGGSPPIELSRNPDKTQGELWDNEKLLKYLNDQQAFLVDARERFKQNPSDEWAHDDLIHAKRELRLSIPYLSSIGKLPEELKGFTVEDLPDDPQK